MFYNTARTSLVSAKFEFPLLLFFLIVLHAEPLCRLLLSGYSVQACFSRFARDFFGSICIDLGPGLSRLETS